MAKNKGGKLEQWHHETNIITSKDPTIQRNVDSKRQKCLKNEGGVQRYRSTTTKVISSIATTIGISKLLSHTMKVWERVVELRGEEEGLTYGVCRPTKRLRQFLRGFMEMFGG
ncbi:hypothetical protein H5410_020102 [Solanum commersonii]|uniref:Uncharacterized protein n=1 Tax=Solanum commersonii TaxID=4109 RepID=A0A9J5Z965_SOLCO|nr:hypothetical protein H5410_020102 [Solanum commersonii]